MFKRLNLLALALGSAVALTALADAEAKPPRLPLFDDVFVFGDSLSDDGNFNDLVALLAIGAKARAIRPLRW